MKKTLYLFSICFMITLLGFVNIEASRKIYDTVSTIKVTSPIVTPGDHAYLWVNINKLKV